MRTIARIAITYGNLALRWCFDNELAVVMIINLAALLCTLILAIHVHVLARRWKRLTLASKRDSALIEALARKSDVHAEAIQSLRGEHPDAASTGQHPANSPTAQGMLEDLEALRIEISAIREEAKRDVISGLAPELPTAEINTLAAARHEIERVRAELAQREIAQDSSPPH